MHVVELYLFPLKDLLEVSLDIFIFSSGSEIVKFAPFITHLSTSLTFSQNLSSLSSFFLEIGSPPECPVTDGSEKKCRVAFLMNFF